jgi:predicted nucleic-acid-binding Zn-ribbon protein
MKCLKCKNDTFDKSIVFARTLDLESRVHRNEDKFEVLTCKKCHLAQWYNYYIAHGEKKPIREYEKSIYEVPKLIEFNCNNCKSNCSTAERIAPLGGIVINTWEGEILLRICTKCGLIEAYQILLTYHGTGGAALKISRGAAPAKGFDCPICKSKKVSQTGEIQFVERLDGQSGYRTSEREVAYLFGTCEKCKYIMVFGGEK